MRTAFNKIVQSVKFKIRTIRSSLNTLNANAQMKRMPLISGQKSTQAGRLRGAAVQERLEKWNENFASLLRQPPTDNTEPE